SSRLTISTNCSATSASRTFASSRPRCRPRSSSFDTTSATRNLFGNARRISCARPVALRLITVLVSPTRAAGSVKRFRDPIGPAPFCLQHAQNFAHLYPIEAQEPGELSFAEKILPVRFRRQQIEPQRRGLLRLGPLPIRNHQIAENLRGLFVGDAALIFEPAPGAGFRQPEFFKTAHDGLPRNAEEMRENDDMAPRQPVRTGGDLVEFLHHAAGRRQERPAERIRVSLLAAVFRFMPMKNLGAAT